MRSYGWIFLLILGLTVAVGLRFVSMVRESREHPRIGDGEHPSTYGFDLTDLAIPQSQLTAAGLPKDGLSALLHPVVYSSGKATSFGGRDKYLVPTDLVIGVWVDGVTRAYPLQILNWHEVVNDTLAGVPIMVSYSPLAGAATAYDRRVKAGPGTESDETKAAGGYEVPREFGLSGLFWNGHHLFYDRQDTPGRESLWSPLLGRPVAGPAVKSGDSLETLAAALVPWQLWYAHHPETTVMGRDEMQLQRYKRKPYVAYFGNDELRFPATPLPNRLERRWKTPMVIPILGDEGKSNPTALSVPHLISREAEDTHELNVDGRRVGFVSAKEPAAAMILDPESGRPLPARHAFWFAWYATHPGGRVR